MSLALLLRACLISAVLGPGAVAAQNAMSGEFGSNMRAMSVVEQQMTAEPTRITLALINQYRAQRGLGPLAIDQQMTAVAYQQARAMADADLMDHNIAGDFGGRLRAHKVLNVYAGENIGRNIRSAEKMFDWWANSPVHERNMTNPRMTRLGFAVAYSPTSGKPYWAMALASGPIR